MGKTYIASILRTQPVHWPSRIYETLSALVRTLCGLSPNMGSSTDRCNVPGKALYMALPWLIRRAASWIFLLFALCVVVHCFCLCVYCSRQLVVLSCNGSHIFFTRLLVATAVNALIVCVFDSNREKSDLVKYEYSKLSISGVVSYVFLCV